nr:MAG TPA: hypothetical protein [Caudoviricetes sp.]
MLRLVQAGVFALGAVTKAVKKKPSFRRLFLLVKPYAAEEYNFRRFSWRCRFECKTAA